MVNKSELNIRLSKQLAEIFPSRRMFINFLCGELSLEREAAYRRAKGEVSFTLHEIYIIAAKLNLSIDDLTLLAQDKYAKFKLTTVSPQMVWDINEFYQNVFIERFERLLKITQDHKTSVISMHSSYSQFFLSNYPTLMRFNVFSLIYQVYPNAISRKFADLQIADSVVQKQRSIYKAFLDNINNPTTIIGQNMFKNFINRINLFKHLDVFSNDDLRNLKNDILTAINRLEELVRLGKYPNGNNVWFYLSDTDLCSNYYILSSKDCESVSIDIYSLLYTIESQDQNMIHIHKQFMESQKKHSTMLSGSAEIARVKFFKEQREYVENNLLIE